MLDRHPWVRLAVPLGIAAFIAAACGSEATTAGTGTEEDGCGQNGDCATDELCDFADGLCGSGERGACVSKPYGCSTGAGPYPIVCGCDGEFHGSECVTADGVDTSVDVSICPAPAAGTFVCGSMFCNASYEYCLVNGDDKRCVPATDCDSCDCLAPSCTGASCSEENGALTVTCAPS